MASLSEALAAAFDLYGAGRTAEAAELCRRILHAAPDQPAAAQIAGAALAALGRRAEAERAFRRFIVLRPGDGGGWANLGAVLVDAPATFPSAASPSAASPSAASASSSFFSSSDAAAADSASGLAPYRRALLCRPDDAAAWSNRAALSMRRGDRAGAVAAARAALVCDPACVDGLINLAEAAGSGAGPASGPGAGLWALRAVRAAPLAAGGWAGLTAALGRAGRAAEAAAAGRRLLALDPARSAGWENLALASSKTGDAALCEAALSRAAAIDGAESVRRARAAASAFLALGRPLDALKELDAALAAAPDDAGLQWNRATALLQAGRWREGWAAFEHRRRDDRAEPPWRDLGVPTWDGRAFPGRRLLLYAEQGLGDAVQMLRFIPLAAALGGEIVLEVQPPLVAAARRTFQAEAVFGAGAGAGGGGPVRVVGRGDPLPPFDLECPLMSLPGLFGATPAHVPGDPASLPPDPARVARLRPATAGGSGGLKVGLAWAGNPRFPDDRRRSPGLATLLPLLRGAPHVRFYVLQQGPGRDDLRRTPAPANLIDPWTTGPADVDDTLAVMAGLDLVVSSCTLPAHLATAAGTPLWLLLSHAPDWRWLLGRDDSPWAPSVRLFRQPAPGDWTTPVDRMTAALRAESLRIRADGVKATLV